VSKPERGKNRCVNLQKHPSGYRERLPPPLEERLLLPLDERLLPEEDERPLLPDELLDEGV
jgi:hypothetical protein